MKQLFIFLTSFFISFSAIALDKTYKDDLNNLTSLSGQDSKVLWDYLKKENVLTYYISEDSGVKTLTYFKSEFIKYSIIYNKNIIGTTVNISYNSRLIKKQDQNQSDFYKEDLENYLVDNGWKYTDLLPKFIQPEITYKKNNNYIIFSSDSKTSLNVRLSNEQNNEILEELEDSISYKLRNMNDEENLEFYKKGLIVK